MSIKREIDNGAALAAALSNAVNGIVNWLRHVEQAAIDREAKDKADEAEFQRKKERRAAELARLDQLHDNLIKAVAEQRRQEAEIKERLDKALALAVRAA